ncbi:MAG: 1,2-phenylacetyl-CoA epoxidase subunit PaaC [Phycisphaerae bacterium]
MDQLPKQLEASLTDLLLSIADDKFILGHRNADWTGLGPMLEEDIAFASLAQDDLAHAMGLYEMIAGFSGGRADAIAYGRTPEQYRCAQLVELSDEFDWSVAIARQFFCDHFDQLRLGRLASSNYKPLRDLAARLFAEERLAIGHADQWVVRLGKGGDDARGRMQAALTRLAPLATALFEPTAGVEQLESAGIYPRGTADMYDQWESAIENVVEAATLELSLPRADFLKPAGRRGVRSNEFAALHTEMTEVYRVEPEASW